MHYLVVILYIVTYILGYPLNRIIESLLETRFANVKLTNVYKDVESL